MTSQLTGAKPFLMSNWHLILFSACTIFTITSFISGALKILPYTASDGLALVAVVAGGTPIAVSAIHALLQKDIDVDLLATIAIIAGVIVGQYLAAALVVLMLSGGEILEDYTAKKTSKAIQLLIESAPKTARVRKNGKELNVPIEQVKVGDMVLVKPGEKIPIDGEVLSGTGSINQASLTGESIAVQKSVNCKVLSGAIVELGALEIRAEKVGEDTTFAHIIKLIREGQANRAPIEKIAHRYARYFAPVLMVIAIGTYIFTSDVIAVVSTLVIACPCALTLATPTAVVASLGNAAKRGILIRGGATLESVGKTNTVVLDKTGTLTLGTPQVVDIKTFNGKSEAQVITLAALAEKFSEHPLAKAVLEKASTEGICPQDPSTFEVFPGQGVMVNYKGKEVLAGNEKLFQTKKVTLEQEVQENLDTQKALGRTVFLVSENGLVIGSVSVADVSRAGVAGAVVDMRSVGVKNVVMLTGDNSSTAHAIANQVGITEVAADLLPEGKVDYVKQLKRDGNKILMVGDGINDAPALAAAHVGVAMGKTGTDVAIETSDAVLISDDLSKVPQMIKIGRKTVSLIKQNILFALTINIIGVTLAASGVINPVLAAVIHEGNALFVVLNSARLIWAK
ncbi:MAG: cation-translocating P-type ATPase [Candidatus Bathyarchaeota archaeon]|nr:cation-translocating P-type ATPase [Candidatus Bathyarchaeota archaeon]